jgi:pterin-4a-carbinolamine dehydratase
VSLKLLRVLLQISGIESIILGFVSWLAQLEVQDERVQSAKIVGAKAYEEALNFLAALADLSQSLTHTPPILV